MHGGHDNVTRVLARFDGEALRPVEPGQSGEVEVRELRLPGSRRRGGLSPLALVAIAVLLMAAVAGMILLIGMD